MELRKAVLISCTIISIFLFIDGIYALAAMNKRVAEKPRSYAESNIEHTGQVKEDEADAVQPVNILILGLDGEEVRSDVIALVNFSPKDGKINILSITRDTKVRAKGKSSKINALIGMGGEKMIAEKVEELTGLPVTYYLTLDFKGFRKIIDTLDGVEVNVPFNMDYDDPEQSLHIHLKKGTQLLDGNKAEQFVRYRKGNRPGEGYIYGDLGRIEAQQEFMKALIEQKAKLKYISKADDIYIILTKYMKTNIDISDINYYLRYLKNIKYENIKSYSLPGESAYMDDLWYFIYDAEKTKKLINKNFSK